MKLKHAGHNQWSPALHFPCEDGLPEVTGPRVVLARDEMVRDGLEGVQYKQSVEVGLRAVGACSGRVDASEALELLWRMSWAVDRHPTCLWCWSAFVA